MTGPRIGSLFSGYGGLDLAVQDVLGGTVAWHAEIEPAACRVLEYRFPGVPNLGDVSVVDWPSVEPVDVIVGGFPCQDVSLAGLRRGMRPDTRSGMWTHMAAAVDAIRPALVLIENVRGLLSARAVRPVGSDDEELGDGGLRAMGAVLGDLADIGFDADWTGLPASRVGAPHGRFRVFVAAWPQSGHPDGVDRYRRATAGQQGEAGPETGRGGLAQDAHVAAGGERRFAAPGQAKGGWSWADAGGRGGAPAADPDDPGRIEHGQPGAARPEHAAAQRGRPDAVADAGDGPDERERARPGPGGRGEAAADADGDGLGRLEELDGLPGPGRDRPADGDDVDGPGVEAGGPDGGTPASTAGFGVYGAAVDRWAGLTRPAPPPTEPNTLGQPRLSPRFVEWMMGLPDGWVTQVPEITNQLDLFPPELLTPEERWAVRRNEQLKLLGNGVVPQQAAHALRELLAGMSEAAA